MKQFRLVLAAVRVHALPMTRPAASLISGLVLAFGLTAPALASEPVATANGTEAPPASTADQVEQFIKASPVPNLPKDGVAGVTASGPRDRSLLGPVHGFVEVGAGTGGYRSVYGAAQIPLGENGALTVSGGEARGRLYRSYGGWRSQSLGASLALGPGALSAGAAGDPRCIRPVDPDGGPTWTGEGAAPACRSVP